MNTNKFHLASYILFLLLFLVDLVALFSSIEVARYIRMGIDFDFVPKLLTHDVSEYYWIVTITLFVFLFEKIYFTRHDFWGDTKRATKGLLFSFLAVFTVITLVKMSDAHYSRLLIFIFFIVALFIVPTFKRIAKNIIFRLDFFKLKVKVIAANSQYELISTEIDKNWYFGFKQVEKNYDMVIIASKNFNIQELQNLIKKYANKTQDIFVIPYMEHLDLAHTTVIDYSNIRLSAIHIENRLLNAKNILIKYVFEKVLVLLIFPFVLFFHIIISLAIRLDSNGSEIFKQKRLGKNSKEFRCYKYRTMYDDYDNILEEYLKVNPDEVEYYETYHKYKDDPRITKVGSFLRKSSLDELPQFYNILLGNMSLIGPRPYMPKEKDKIGRLNEKIILKVKPGITGLWQVSGRNSLTFKQRVDLDAWYIQNWSLWMDLVIFIKTIKVVFTKIGAS